MTPQTRRRIANFRANRRGYVSFIAFCALFGVSLFAEFIANDKPLLVKFDGDLLVPVLKSYPETRFGGDFPTEADYHDEYVVELIEAKGWMVWPPIPYSYKTVVHGRPAPAPPSRENWLGTDDQSRDVAARLIYGFRISVLFGLVLTLFSIVIGVSAGVTQGFFGGWLDLGFQRFMEIWAAMPTLYLLIILASVVQPTFWWLLGILLLFSWMGYVAVVRAEVLRARNLDFVRAARALGVSNLVIMFRHVMPNALVATITFLPFNLSAAITSLTALDFLGFGLPPGSASLGEMVTQGRNNLHAPWLGLTSFAALATMLVLLIFTGEAIRDAFDPRVTHGAAPAEGETA
ncbi:ABC transporter permease [Candidatus Poribacteria bacterium]|nr:ABC transporter permease [Candidatus Poribacteria bacterium]MBT5715153.1 ABC transporter permease [Candidatus Poribacteria bacterium]MBT7097690.1 ABC transporter permease [Candidatus Poribacteria bacterium]MBT7807386.1 ABC transporter permease [Candidatus Poribacteria bacterium]